MQLAAIPPILSLLEQKSVITAEQKSEVLAALDREKAEGRTAFAGEMGIKLGFYTKETLDVALIEQTALKAEAAVQDIQEIIQTGKQHPPAWLNANWGNNGVNPPRAEPTVADAVSAAANIAQNIVMIANETPDIAKDLTTAISALANLARGIANGPSATVPLDTMSEEWVETSKQGLRLAIEKSGYRPTDRNGTEVNVEDFIAARFQEIQKGIELSAGKNRGSQETHAR